MIPQELVERLHVITLRINEVIARGDLLTQASAKSLLSLIQQALLLAHKYDAVVTNPPYMGSRFHYPGFPRKVIDLTNRPPRRWLLPDRGTPNPQESWGVNGSPTDSRRSQLVSPLGVPIGVFGRAMHDRRTGFRQQIRVPLREGCQGGFDEMGLPAHYSR